jgi:hypothetical protein
MGPLVGAPLERLAVGILQPAGQGVDALVDGPDADVPRVLVLRSMAQQQHPACVIGSMVVYTHMIMQVWVRLIGRRRTAPGAAPWRNAETLFTVDVARCSGSGSTGRSRVAQCTADEFPSSTAYLIVHQAHDLLERGPAQPAALYPRFQPRQRPPEDVLHGQHTSGCMRGRVHKGSSHKGSSQQPNHSGSSHPALHPGLRSQHLHGQP